MISQFVLLVPQKISLASNVGNYLDLTTVGIGTSHTFTSQDQNTKCIVALDNNIQDPVIPGNVEHSLVEEMNFWWRVDENLWNHINLWWRSS